MDVTPIISINRVITFRLLLPEQDRCESLDALKNLCTFEFILEHLRSIRFPLRGKIYGATTPIIPPPVGWVLSIEISIEDSIQLFDPPIDEIAKGSRIRLLDFFEKSKSCGIL